MTDRLADLDAALDRVVEAARAHLAAVKAADGERDDDAVWDAYVTLNNVSHTYDQLLNDAFGEVTPWDLEAISGDELDADAATIISGEPGAEVAPNDPYAHVLSVRQRRDYRVPSITALLRLAEEARAPIPEGESVEPIESVSEAVLELLASGDGSLAMLDVPELEPLDGVVVVVEVPQPFNPDEHDDSDGEAPFRLTDSDRTMARLDERALPADDE